MRVVCHLSNKLKNARLVSSRPRSTLSSTYDVRNYLRDSVARPIEIFPKGADSFAAEKNISIKIELTGRFTANGTESGNCWQPAG